MSIMKKFLYISVFCAAALFVACTQDLTSVEIKPDSPSEKIINNSTNAARGSILVCFAPEAESRLASVATRSGATRTGVADVDVLLDEISGYSIEPVFVVTEKNREKVYNMGLHLWYELFFDAEADLDVVASRLAKVAEVQVVQFSKEVKRVTDAKRLNITPFTGTRATPQSNIPFNDPQADYQWHYDNLGYGKCAVTGGKLGDRAIAGGDVNAVAAWKLCMGDPSIIVAVNDEGVCNEHEDLAENCWVNTKEIAGNGKDDDENGYIDDIYGFNFVSNTGKISWNKSGDSGHGSHVAGTIAAVNNNGIGCCGIAGGSGKGDGVRIMSTQVFSGSSGSTNSKIAKSIQYAADNGALILQCSWGVDGGAYPNDNVYTQYEAVEKRAIDYFIANAGGDDSPITGGLAIFAAGNEWYATPGYPAAYKECICVTAHGPALKPAWYTNYGPGADIAAPGGDDIYGTTGQILSTTPIISGQTNSYYSYMVGTSMACPHVSGVAALGLSYAKQLGKHFTASEFRSMLLTAVNDINPYMNGTRSFKVEDIYGREQTVNLDFTEYANQMGAGYVDAFKLLLQVEGTPFATVVANNECEIDIKPYFAKGSTAVHYDSITISDEDRQALGITNAELGDGVISFKCSNVGTADITIKAIVGGTSTTDTSKPTGTFVEKRIVVISRTEVAQNGGWL